jgi:predicted dehydrogenase
MEPSIDALEHGKSVLCEKPLATNSQDARRMLDAARRAGVTTMVGFNYRRVPAVTLARQMIKEGRLGRIYQIRSQFFEDWGGPDCPHTWRFKSETAGAGALADLGSHALDMVRYLVGEPIEVCSLQGRFIDERKLVGKKRSARSNVDDTAMALLRIEGGILGEVAASWLATGRKVALDFEVHGSEGSLSFSMERPNELNHYSSKDPQDARGFKRIYFGSHHPYGSTLIFGSPSLGTGYVDSLVNQMHDLMIAMREETQIEPSFYDGWKVNVAIDAILESSRKGRWIHVG